MASQNLARYQGSRNMMPMGVMPLGEALNQLFRDAFTSPSGGAGFTAMAGVNLFEKDDSYILQIPLPGVKLDQLNITVRENVVTLQGTMEIAPPDGARAIYQGVGGGQFREQVALPSDVDAEQANAQYQDGVLILTLPRAQHARERTVAVSRGQSSQTQTHISGNGRGQGQTNATQQSSSSTAEPASSGSGR